MKDSVGWLVEAELGDGGQRLVLAGARERKACVGNRNRALVSARNVYFQPIIDEGVKPVNSQTQKSDTECPGIVIVCVRSFHICAVSKLMFPRVQLLQIGDLSDLSVSSPAD
ncbi:hypothetical protein BaRGS_00028937 [Batillaria attramentaria]|uniref:Uncharacterized protein n=1 Tax=Batillaria attramentaria TaxID=370345 RepID=A0ABD0JXS0_9CAEN